MKLRELKISHLRCIEAELTVKIDNIVVLIGSNNVGKSTIIYAYQLFSGTGPSLTIQDFHNHNFEKPVSITGIFSDLLQEDIEKIGKKWVFQHHEYGNAIKYKWEWHAPDTKGEKHSWDEDSTSWIKGGMGGWDSKIASCLPIPLIISPYEDPLSLESKIIEILTSAIKDNIQSDESKLNELIKQFEDIAHHVHTQIATSLEHTTNSAQETLQQIFPKHSISIELKAGKIEPEKVIATGSQLHVTDPEGTKIPLCKQGTGLQRAFLWSAVSALSNSGNYKIAKKSTDANAPRILIIEEPEIFLHPPAIRAARESLYQISTLDNWQVLITTHSPIFIDVSKAHTTIIRIAKNSDGGRKIFSTDDVTFNEDERKRLQMIRSCHPTVNEFFFSENIILVEGDTEVALFNKILAEKDISNKYQIVNCYGKANIPMFQKILNHFDLKYIVIHDVDSPKVRTKESYKRNSMWSINSTIFNEAKDNLIIAHAPNLEQEYFGMLVKGDKPFNAIQMLEDEEFKKTSKYKSLLNFFSLIENKTHPGIIKHVDDYKIIIDNYVANNSIDDHKLWSHE
ncbi:TPA: AAA family ATPase [Legionella pneumophila]|nr:AAA family ATPase [Legionella pneumophila]HAT1883526.1 AAA family ATPase [Legionella pneumophila]HAT2114819.1 AAA family ATPase [Legionella pneumophila]HAT8721362.1 AAA family ATPase [Legionella pneumophila]HAU1199860.1 AAA family ATPase [Legionella pneumophila]HAU1873420.1 AAA family ATPase [Legionella pneumophila]